MLAACKRLTRLPSCRSSCRRAFATTPRQRVQHLLWSGTLLDQSTSTFTPFDPDLFFAAGAAEDFDSGITLLTPSSSPTRGHSLLPYSTKEGLSRILAIGRNTHAQLGLGFSSQEATFGLIRPGFSGQGGIHSVHAGPSQSFILTSNKVGRATDLFACGNNTLGQLGLGDASIPYDSEPQLHIFPAPRQVPLDKLAKDGNDADAVASFAIGIDHAVLLLHNPESQSPGSVFSTGMNGDGQLGRTAAKFGYASTFDEVKTPPSAELLHLAAGGDTSVAWCPSSLFVWGNTEYGQALLEGEDQLSVPADVTGSVSQSLGDSTIKDVKVAGSALFILDSSGRVFSSGFGPTGRRGDSALHCIEGLPSIASLSVSLDSVMARSSDGRRVFVWGLDANGGTLGLGSWDRDGGGSGSGASQVSAAGSPDTQAQEAGGEEQEEGEEWQGQDIVRRVHRPVELDLSRWLGDRGHVESICCGGEASFVVVEDGEEPREIWQPRGGLVRR